MSRAAEPAPASAIAPASAPERGEAREGAPARSSAGAGRPVTRSRALLLALGPVLLWGVSFPVSRVAVREIAPVALATVRFALATAILWPLARRRGLRLEPADRLAMLGIGLLGATLYFVFENYGLLLTTASHASLIVATVPLGSAAVEAFQRRRLPRPLALAGMAVAVAGVVVIVRPDGAGWLSVLGDLLVLGAMISWVAYTFLARRMMARYPALLVTARIMAVGTATLLPLAIAEAFFLPPRLPSAGAVGAVVYLGLLCSAAAYLMWNVAFPALGVSVANNLLNLIPLVSVLTAVAALGEPFTAGIAVGGALILAGVFVVERTGV
jgi:drug/metabolite transporter (DMT)-like permease